MEINIQHETEKTPRPRSRARIPLFAAVALAAVSALTAGCRSQVATQAGQTSAAAPIQVSVARVVDAGFPRTLEITGSVAAQYQATLSTRIMGRVDSVLVKEGDTVRRGQAVVLLNTADMDAAVSGARANLSAAQSQLVTAHAALAMETAQSPARVEAAAAKVSEAKQALLSARSQLALVLAGPRHQEKDRAGQDVAQAQSSLALARGTFDRMNRLYEHEAISGLDFDRAKSALDTAQAQYQSAALEQNQLEEGSRPEEKQEAQDAVGRASSALADAQAGLAQARAGTLSVSLKRADVASAQSAVQQAHAALDAALANRSYATISAPFDGVITARTADPGAMAGPGVALLTIEGGDLRLEANLPESALSAVHAGMSVNVTLDALGNVPISAGVVSIARRGDPASHTFIIKLRLPQAGGARAGMYGRADLLLGSDHYPAVPQDAVMTRDGLSYMYVLENDGVARLRFVTTGRASGGYVPLLSGGRSGDRIVVSDVDKIHDGERVAETED